MTATRLLDAEFIAKIEQLELVSRKVISGVLKGDRLSKRRGHSTEFADFRPYAAGDDLRFLDWNIYARLERLFLKLFLEEEDLTLNILLDASPSMDYGKPSKLEYSRQVAAALAYIGLVNRDRVCLTAFAQSAQAIFGPARGRRQTSRLLEVLENLQALDASGTDLAEACRGFSVGRRGGGIVLIITDFLDRAGFEKGLRYLLSGPRSTEIFVLHILSPQEINPDLVGDLRLVDVEDGMVTELSTSSGLLKSYRKTLDAFSEEIRAFCARCGMHYVFASTALPFDKLVLEYLKQRGLLR